MTILWRREFDQGVKNLDGGGNIIQIVELITKGKPSTVRVSAYMTWIDSTCDHEKLSETGTFTWNRLKISCNSLLKFWVVTLTRILPILDKVWEIQSRCTFQARYVWYRHRGHSVTFVKPKRYTNYTLLLGTGVINDLIWQQIHQTITPW